MLKQLRYFQSVVRLNSFSAAAEENYISQSAISQQIQALERELGFPLLERNNRSFTLTPAGAYFYQKSLILTADYARMCREAAKIAKGDRASLKIGYLRCYAGAEFRLALEVFSEKHPEVEVSVIYGTAVLLEEVGKVIAPGIIVTPLALDEFNGPRGDFYKNMFAKCPAGRPGTADEVANVAELLMSDKGAFISGSTFLIDGGATASYFYGPLKPEQ